MTLDAAEVGDSMITTIEISYAIAIAMIVLFGVLTYTKKMSIGVALFSAMTGLGISYYLAPYMQSVITPVGNAVIYGYSWGLTEILAAGHLISIAAMVFVAGYNLVASDGEVIWA